MEVPNSINLIKGKRIAIIGGGPGGLTLARLLQLKGANVKVYERDHSQEARVQGAIVDLHFDSGLKVIDAAGLMDEFKASYMVGADKYRVVDKNARILLDETKEGTADDFSDKHFRPEIDRGALRDVLIASLLPGTVVWDSQFAGMEQTGEAWKIQFKNGTNTEADIVIGSDGYRSKVRAYVTDSLPLYSGATIIQGEIDDPENKCPQIYKLLNNANLMAMDEGKTIAVQPRGDGGLTFYAASLYPENWIGTSGIDLNDSAAVSAYLQEFHEGWSSAFMELFKACEHFVARPLNYFPLDEQWEAKGNITLIGDAAHLMPPSGEGVNTAMLDALDLSECLTNEKYESVPAALASFEQIMFERARVLSREAVEGIKDFASPSKESVDTLLKQFIEGAQ